MIQLLNTVISNWEYLFRTIILITFVLIGFGIFAHFILRRLRSTNVQIVAGSTTIRFGDTGRLLTYLVDPRVWNETEIHVHAGDSIVIEATGSIHIAMGRMVRTLQRMYDIKEKNQKELGTRDFEAFTDDQKHESIYDYPWVGPDGLDIGTIEAKDMRERLFQQRKLRIYTDASAGQLLAVIAPADVDPRENAPSSKIQVEKLGRRRAIFTARRDGYLWFVVNDIVSTDPLIQKIMWQDNLGFFSTSIRIEKE